MDPDNPDIPKIMRGIAGKDIVTLVSTDKVYELLNDIMMKSNKGVMVKRALSLDDAYSGDIRNLRLTDNILIIKFKGFVLPEWK
jgi:hypothetical protein